MYEYYHDDSRQPPFFGPTFEQPGGPPGGMSGPPSGPPPSFTPPATQSQGPGVFAIDPGAIRPCIGRFVFLRLTTGERFWAWLIFVGRRSASGWRWTGFRWIYFGVDLRNIESFTCF